ncbi:MAG: Ig-like domain-containing protein [Bacteroidales bacterium]|nr:Ig-like domain-containing protein [Bacteroidales bacterium]
MKTLTTALKLAFAIATMAFASQALADTIFQENFQTRPDGIGFGGTANWTNTDVANRPGNEGLWNVATVTGNRFAQILPPGNTSTVGNNAWLISNSFQLTQGVPVLVTFRVRRPAASALESLRVHIGTLRPAVAMQGTTPIWEIEDLSIPDWITVRVRFVPQASGNHFIGFNARSPMHNNALIAGIADGGVIFIDDIAILEIPDYDLGVERLPFQFAQIPDGIAPSVVKITNTGNLLQTDVVVSAHINGKPASLPAIPTLLPGQEIRVGFPAVSGRRDTLTDISVASAQFNFPDTLLRNDTIIYVGTPNVLAQDTGVNRLFLSTFSAINRPGDIAGMIYEFTEPTNISQIMMHFVVENRHEFRLELYEVLSNNMLNPTPIFSQLMTRNGVGGWQSFDIEHASPIPPGRYFIAVNQDYGTQIWFSGDASTSRFFYERERGGNRIMPVQRTHQHVPANVATGTVGGLAMRLVMESAICTPATNLAVEYGPGSATFTWTPVGTGSQTFTLMHGTDTIQSILLEGQRYSHAIVDLLTPEATGYTWSLITHCDAGNSLVAIGPGFDAKTCQVNTIVVTDATLPHGINFEDDIFICLEQEVNDLSTDGDPFLWERSRTVFSLPPSYGFQLAQRTVITMGMGTSRYPRRPEDAYASTKLILPTFDLSGITDDPILRIRRAATRIDAGNDVADTLRVYFRTNPTEDWGRLASVGNATDAVTEGGTFGNQVNIITLELPRSPTLQIAFEGLLTASGAGVYIDSMYFLSAAAGELTVQALTPNLGAEDVSVMAAVTARFNRNIREGSNFANITIVNSAGESYKIGATISQSTLTINTERFFDTTTYTVHIPAGAVQSMGGLPNNETTWSFTTGREPIHAGIFTPFLNQTAVPTTNTEISVLFANNVVSAYPDSLKKITLRRVITCAEGDTLRPADTVQGVSVELDGLLLRLIAPELLNSTMYEVTIPAGSLHHQANEIRPMYGGQWRPWRFETATLVVVAMGGAPNFNATNVALDAPVWLRFNRAIEPFLNSTLLDQVTIKNAAGTPVAVTVRIVGDTLHIDREGNFQPSTQYTVTVPAMLVANTTSTVWSFTTGTETSILEPVSLENNVMIHPNPVSDVLHIQSQEPVLRVEIFNLQGQLLRQINEAVSEVQVSELSAGTYILKVTTAKGIATQRFIKR